MDKRKAQTFDKLKNIDLILNTFSIYQSNI
jgi:hypothetical protein